MDFMCQLHLMVMSHKNVSYMVKIAQWKGDFCQKIPHQQKDRLIISSVFLLWGMLMKRRFFTYKTLSGLMLFAAEEPL